MTHWFIGLWSNHMITIFSTRTNPTPWFIKLSSYKYLKNMYTARWHQVKELDFSPMWSTVHQITLNPVNMGINFYKNLKIIVENTIIFTINAINFKITCVQPANNPKSKYDLFISNSKLLSTPLSTPKKSPLFTSSSVRLTSKC